MADFEDVCVLLPTYNEAEAIVGVIERFHDAGFEDVLVMDGGSSDGTRELASDAGARVEVQSGSGKGQAVREAVAEHIDAPHVLMMDGDATYRPEEAERMLEPLRVGRTEHVIGDRFANMESGAMTRLNRFGNRLINRTFRFIHGRNLQDILSGYRAFTRESFERLTLGADGFGIETEMAVECVRQNVRTEVVPITYESRPAASETNLRPFRDGSVIMLTLYQMARKNNPIFYFGSFGALSALVGLFLTGFVGYSWVFRGVSHEVIALAAGVAVLFGLQLIMFGVLSDLIVTANREQMRELERISASLEALERAETDPHQSNRTGVDSVADGGKSESVHPGDGSSGESGE